MQDIRNRTNSDIRWVETRITIKKITNDNAIRLILERPGANGFQRFTHEISIDVTRGTVVQTAYDELGNLVSQRNGMSKNNYFDVKNINRGNYD